MDNILTDRQAGRQIESLQILRGLAFLGIFTSHCKITSLGAWGASVFFVLSGFLMTYRYINREIELTIKSVLSFSLKKISKLYYLHILMLLFEVLIPVLFKGTAVLKVIKTDAIKIFLNIFLLQSWIPHGNYYFSLNDVSWFLSDCVFLYTTFPFFLYLIKKISSIRSAFICIVIVYLTQLLIGFSSQLIVVPISVSDNFQKWMTYICPLYRLGDFCIGGFLGYIWIKHPKKQNENSRLYNTFLEVLTFIIFILTQMIYTGDIKTNFLPLSWFRYSCLYLPSSLLLVYIFASEKGLITRTIHYKWLLFLGNISAFAYLIHQVAIHYIEWTWAFLFGENINILIKFFFSLLLTVLCAVFF